MTSPIESLRVGIIHGDWEQVTNAFNALAGAKLKAPITNHYEDKLTRLVERIKLDISDWLQLANEEASPHKGASPHEREASPPKSKRKTQKTKEQVSPATSSNRFVDDLSLCVNEIDSDKKCMPKQPRERRDEFKQASVDCIKCNNNFNVHPALLVFDENEANAYICDTCLAQGCKHAK